MSETPTRMPRPRTATIAGAVLPAVTAAARTRAWLAAGTLTLLLGGVGWKAWGIQVADGARLREQAERQHVHTVEIPAPRGAILDARGRPMAISADTESVFANPRAVVDVAGAADGLARTLGLEVNLLEARLASRKHFVWIARRVSPAQAAAVRKLGLTGVDVTHEPRRWYPGQSSGGPVLGFSGIDGNGLDGLELQMDGLLTGQRARFSALRDARGKTMLADGMSDATPGATVQLTLDRAIQHIADQALAEAVTTHKAKSGTVVVLDVATGAVLAMASQPTYDPNDPAEAVRAQARNRAVTDVYEIGSVMKVFTVAAALDAGVIRPDEWWNVEGGSWKIGRKTIRDVHHDEALTTGGIIKRSSNVGAVKIGLRLGRERLYAALRRFGFGQDTGIELPGEQSGRVRSGASWREIELVTISFGYGFTVSPIQMAAALAAIGNRGVYHEPRIIERVTDATGALIHERKPPARAIMKPATAAALLPMLASVFDRGSKDAGTAGSLWVPGFKAGGKTGTAHKYDPAIRRYADDKYLSSFAGLAPIGAPRIAIVVVIDEPSGGDYFGGKVAGPVFAKVASDTLRYLGVPGDAPMDAPPLKPLASHAARPVMPIAPTREAAGDGGPLIDALAPGDAHPIPDFAGMSIGKALATARARGIDVVVSGSGRCGSQSPPAGAAAADTVVTLHFADPSGPTAAPVAPTSSSAARE